MQKTIIVLLVATACLIGVCMAEPQPVDGGWQRSDGVPVETPTAAPTESDADAAVTTAAEPQPGDAVMEPEAVERRADVGGLVAVGLCGLLALTALWCCLRWGRVR